MYDLYTEGMFLTTMELKVCLDTDVTNNVKSFNPRHTIV